MDRTARCYRGKRSRPRSGWLAIRRIANQPGIGGYRKIAAALADEGITVSHMKVKRMLEKTTVEVD